MGLRQIGVAAALAGMVMGAPTAFGAPSHPARSDGRPGVATPAEPAAETASAGEVEVVRRAGADRVATAAAVSAAVREQAHTVLLAGADSPTDALAAAPLAGALDAPVLLTDHDHLSVGTAEEIRRLGADTVVLLGGTAAVSRQVAEDVTELGARVERIAGPDRFGTAAAIATRLEPESALLVRGASANAEHALTDAVAASSLAARTRQAVLLTLAETLPEATVNVLRDAGIRRVTVVGGPAAVSDAVVAAVGALGIDVARLSGLSRYETSQQLLASDRAAGASDAVWVATGRGTADALAAGPAAATAGAGLLLIDGRALGADQLRFEAYAELLMRTTAITVVGGEEAITPAVTDAISQLAAGGPPGNPDAEVPDCDDLEEPADVDGPLSPDPEVARAQQERADYGLPSDRDTVEELFVASGTRYEFGFPASDAEVEEVFGRNDVAFTYGPLVRDYAAAAAPDTFAGMWLDHVAGGVLRAAFTDDARRHEAALQARHGPDAPIATTEVATSLATLSAVRARVELPEYPGEDAIVSGHGIDVKVNRLGLSVQAVDVTARRILAAEYGGERICVHPAEGPPRSAPPGGGVDGAIALPATEIPNGEAALFGGAILQGDPNLGGGCLWVTEASGEHTSIIWPPKYAVLFTDDGFDLLDADGDVVARDGDVVDLGGGFHDSVPDRCDVTDGAGSFIAGSVILADAQ